MQLLIRLIDNLTETIGKFINSFALLMALITTVLVVGRYGFNMGSIALQELVIYLHASLFLLGAAYGLKHGAHVRVDIFYQRFSPRQRAWVDSVGAIVFLLPLTAFIGFVSWEFVSHSWAIREVSSDTGGIPAVFLLKSLITAFALTLFLQGIAEVLRNLLYLLADEGSTQEQHRA